jgi:hypothetical protein
MIERIPSEGIYQAALKLYERRKLELDQETELTEGDKQLLEKEARVLEGWLKLICLPRFEN